MMQWIRQLTKRLFGKKDQQQAAFEIPMENAEAMIQMIEKTLEVELSCDEVSKLMGEYAELAMRGEDVEKLMPLVQHHLSLCSNCREEFDAVIRILRSSSDLI